DKAKAGEVFDLLEKFANYGFNKSHAAAYAVVSYQTAYLKANYPVEFMAAVMNCDIHLTDKLNVSKREVDRLGIPVVAPCVNRSQALFSVADGALIYALGALKNVGVEAMKLIVAARGETPFADLFDFARRVDMKRIGKRPLEMLARAGAFDVLDRNRRRVFDALDALVAYSASVLEQAASGQSSLFGAGGDDLPPPRLTAGADWLPMERLAAEHQAVGFYLSGHPLDDYARALKRKQVLSLTDIERQALAGPMVARIAGSVSARQERKSARGNRFAFVQLSDPTGLYEVTVFSDVLEATRTHLEPGNAVVLTVEATMEADTLKLLARGVQPVDSVVADAGASGLRVRLADAQAVAALGAAVAEAREGPTRSFGPLVICLPDPDTGGEIEIDAGEKLPATPATRARLRAVDGVLDVEEI
ncbi:MAG: DNA polymerase III subunit alpha, partial [Pararhodobacter sp.]|nr:DNA polymerase III subunit alpha [Pararhodobacter sp.]